MHAGTLGRELAGIARALPDWRRQLALRIAAHDLALAAHRALGDQDERIDLTRRAVWRSSTAPVRPTRANASSTRTSLSCASSSAISGA